MSNIVKCIEENAIRELSKQLRVQPVMENFTVLLFNILSDKPAKFAYWRDCKFSTPAEFKNQLFNFDMGSLSIETLQMVKENKQFNETDSSSYYGLTA